MPLARTRQLILALSLLFLAVYILGLGGGIVDMPVLSFIFDVVSTDFLTIALLVAGPLFSLAYLGVKTYALYLVSGNERITSAPILIALVLFALGFLTILVYMAAEQLDTGLFYSTIFIFLGSVAMFVGLLQDAMRVWAGTGKSS
ncbi:MAG: hypothetical protein WAS36_05240 [Candidatus Saccharimonadales bacterium]